MGRGKLLFIAGLIIFAGIIIHQYLFNSSERLYEKSSIKKGAIERKALLKVNHGGSCHKAETQKYSALEKIFIALYDRFTASFEKHLKNLEELKSNSRKRESNQGLFIASENDSLQLEEKYLAMAQEFYRKGKYKEAEINGRIAVILIDEKKLPIEKKRIAHEFLASACMKTCNYSSALEEYKLLVSIDRENRSYRMKAKAARKALNESQLKMASSYMKEARKCYDKALYQEAIIYAEKALAVFKACGGSGKDIALSLEIQGKSYYRKKDCTQAKSYLERARRIDPLNKETNRLLAEIENYTKDVAETPPVLKETVLDDFSGSETGGIYYSNGTYKNYTATSSNIYKSKKKHYYSDMDSRDSYTENNGATYYYNNTFSYNRTYSASSSNDYIENQNEQLINEQNRRLKETQERNQEIINRYSNQKNYNPVSGNSFYDVPSYRNPSYTAPSYQNPSFRNFNNNNSR